MLFSIIMPAYNAEKTIGHSIESVLQQNFNAWELIIVDDGSTDYTKKICEKYVNKDSRIRYIRHENNGVSSARNEGMAASKGEYIVFLDSDDFLTPDCLEIYATLYKKNKVDLIISNYFIQTNCILAAREINIKQVNSKEEKKRLIETALSQSQYHGINWYGNLHSVWGKCFKRDIIVSNSVSFNEHLKIGEDLLFFLLYVLECSNIFLTDDKTYIYTINMNSTMHSAEWKGNQMGNLLFNEVEKITQNMVSNQALMDLWTEIAENDWNCIHRLAFTLKNKYCIFKKIIKQKTYIRFSNRNIKQYSSRKQRIYCMLIRKNAVLLLMLLSYCRMLKNNFKVSI